MASLYSVTYNTNGSTAGITPLAQTANSDNTTYSFTTPQQDDLLKTNYIFVGWSEDPNAIIAQYIPGETITLTSNNPNKTLYATWVSLAPTTWSELYYMQQMNPTACSSATESTNSDNQKQLIDSRDGKRYWVAKLADGKCWMTQNLAIDLTGKTLTASDSDVTNNWSPVSAWGSNNNTIAWQISTTGSEHASYGGYYSWQAATANTAPANTGTAPSSICPKGWRLPTGNTGEFQALVNKGKSGWTTNNGINGYWLGGTSNVAGAAFFPAGGFVDGGSLYSAGSLGYYWSSTSYSATRAYYLLFSSSDVYPSNDRARYYGHSVRCVAR